jgi:hypothetical protein
MSRISAVFLVLVFVAVGVARPTAAEQITIMVVNGRTGVPMKDQPVYVWFEKVNPAPLSLKTDTNGRIVFPVEGQRESFLVGLVEQFVVDCRSSKNGYNDYGNYVYRISDVLGNGVIATNHCGNVLVNPKPGQLVLFSRPLTFWENVRNFLRPA